LKARGRREEGSSSDSETMNLHHHLLWEPKEEVDPVMHEPSCCSSFLFEESVLSLLHSLYSSHKLIGLVVGEGNVTNEDKEAIIAKIIVLQTTDYRLTRKVEG